MNKKQNVNPRDGGSSAQRVPTGVLDDRELIWVRLPDVLGAVVVFGGDNDFVGNEERRVETHTELANQLWGWLIPVLHLCHLVEELAGAGLGDGAQVLHQILFGHSNTSVSDVEHVPLLIRLGIIETTQLSYQQRKNY